MYIQCIHVWINAYLAATVPVTTRLLQPSIHSVCFCHLRPGYGLVPIEDQNVPRQQIIFPCCLGNNVTRTFFRSIHGTLMASWYTILYGSKPADVHRITALNSIQKLFQRMMACFFLPLIQYPCFLEGTWGQTGTCLLRYISIYTSCTLLSVLKVGC